MGSNAVRLLLSRVIYTKKQWVYNKDCLVRIPLRLGEDVFTNGKISAKKITQLCEVMEGFKHIIKFYKPLDLMACATSAMRDASNQKAVLAKIRDKSGIPLKIISGKKEAEIIYSNHIEKLLKKNKHYLYIDVGGGSTELTLFSGTKPKHSNSFNLGTVRILKNKDKESEWERLIEWVESLVGPQKSVVGIASGGNINKLVNLAKSKANKNISYSMLKKLYGELSALSTVDRMVKYKLREDRADVIVPAAKIFLTIMEYGHISELIVPVVGLSDGLVHLMHEKISPELKN